MSEPLATTNPRRAWHDGRAAGRAEVAVVLLDLIVELRDGGCWERFIAGDGYTSIGHNDGWAKDIADRAEARLNDVSMSLNKGHDDE